MTFVRGAAVVFFVAGAMASEAADSVMGRWAVDEAACAHWYGSPSPLIVNDTSLCWSSGTCRIERTYKAGGTVHIQAMCWSDAGEKSIPVSLRPQGGKLVVAWDHAPRGALRRCP